MSKTSSKKTARRIARQSKRADRRTQRSAQRRHLNCSPSPEVRSHNLRLTFVDGTLAKFFVKVSAAVNDGSNPSLLANPMTIEAMKKIAQGVRHVVRLYSVTSDEILDLYTDAFFEIAGGEEFKVKAFANAAAAALQMHAGLPLCLWSDEHGDPITHGLTRS